MYVYIKRLIYIGNLNKKVKCFDRCIDMIGGCIKSNAFCNEDEVGQAVALPSTPINLITIKKQ
jgi:hypothetical protein